MYFDQASIPGAKHKKDRHSLVKAGLITGAVLLPVLLVGFSSNPPTGLTGAPGEGNCQGCHNGPGAGTLSVTFPGALTYTPGGPAVSWTVNSPGGSGGFELSTRVSSSNAQAGTLTAGPSSAISTSGGIQYALQSSPATSWAIQWTPPATDAGNIIVYVTGVDSGFNAYATSYTLTSAATPPPGSITVSPAALTFNFSGTPLATQSFQVTSSGASLAFTTGVSTVSGGNWLSATPPGGNTPMGVTVTADPTGLAAGAYMGTVTVTASGASNSPQTVSVTLNVGTSSPPPMPTLSVSPNTLSFSSSTGNSQNVKVTASDGSAQAFTASVSTTAGGNWLSATPMAGSTPATVAVSVNPTALAAGTYNGQVSLTAGGVSNSPQTVGVTLVVGTTPPPTTPGPLNFSFSVDDKQSGGSEFMLLSGSGAIDSSGKLTGSGMFTRYTVGKGEDDSRHTLSTGRWNATGIVSFTPPSMSNSGDDDGGARSGGILEITVDLKPSGAPGSSATMKIADTGTQRGVTLSIQGGATFVPTGTGHVSITKPGRNGGDGDN